MTSAAASEAPLVARKRLLMPEVSHPPGLDEGRAGRVAKGGGARAMRRLFRPDRRSFNSF